MSKKRYENESRMLKRYIGYINALSEVLAVLTRKRSSAYLRWVVRGRREGKSHPDPVCGRSDGIGGRRAARLHRSWRMQPYDPRRAPPSACTRPRWSSPWLNFVVLDARLSFFLSRFVFKVFTSYLQLKHTFSSCLSQQSMGISQSTLNPTYTLILQLHERNSFAKIILQLIFEFRGYFCAFCGHNRLFFTICEHYTDLGLRRHILHWGLLCLSSSKLT